MNANSVVCALSRHFWPRYERGETGPKDVLEASSQLPSDAHRSPILLEWRLTALEQNPKEIERHSPKVLANLRSTCALCAQKRRCLEDMMDYRNPPWESYCPNSRTIRTFLAAGGATYRTSSALGDARKRT